MEMTGQVEGQKERNVYPCNCKEAKSSGSRNGEPEDLLRSCARPQAVPNVPDGFMVCVPETDPLAPVLVSSSPDS